MLLLVACIVTVAVAQPAHAPGGQQEDTARHTVRAPRSMPPFLPRIGGEIPDAGGAPGTVAELDSLVRIHPELRALLLRQFLVPSHALPDFTPLSDRDRFAAYMREHIPVSPFERMSQLARRHAENFDIPLHPAFRDYQVDIVATIHWLLGLAP